ncbi:CDP-glycerol--glycerophosphate glycerophosphotransferase [Bacillus sp. MUM 116]|nr:CDP-glycerol--glycerophosphate glycerophosphotransferase [Bacillus sp. MUM 116]
MISIYLLLFKCLFALCNLLPLKNKVTFVVSFGDNSKYVYQEMCNQKIPFETVFLCKGLSKRHFLSYRNIKLLTFESINVIDTCKSIYHLATSKYIIIDNYFGFLAVTNFKHDVECIQLWHAAGAIKKFGLEDQSIGTRSKRANERFLQVYEKFHKVVVGSDAMAAIFKNAFNLDDQNILRTGIPRSDFFYDVKLRNDIILQLISENEDIKYKKVILYAPTFRDGQLDQFKLHLDIEKMYHKLRDHYIVLLRLHPAVKNTTDFGKNYPGFVYDYSSPKVNINELLLVTDILISDYSSIPYEFSLLNKPMIFFAYDLLQYKKERGLWDDFQEIVPGPVVYNTEEIINIILENKFDLEKIKEFSKKWNKYSKGKSSENLVHYLFMEEKMLNLDQQKAL